MRKQDLESRVGQIAQAVAAGRKVEDSRVELKAEWPEPQKAARRIAGHANASSPEPIIWIIGIDEDAHTIQTPSRDNLMATQGSPESGSPQKRDGFDIAKMGDVDCLKSSPLVRRWRL